MKFVKEAGVFGMPETIKERMIRLREFEAAARPVMEKMARDILDLVYMMPRNECASRADLGCACSGACMKPEVKEIFNKLEEYYKVMYGYKPPSE
jgi:Ethanolamine utilization protein EutJ (predicted chaperonin)